MLGAIFIVHGEHGFFMNWYGAQQGKGFEYHLLALWLAVAVMIKGSDASPSTASLATARVDAA